MINMIKKLTDLGVELIEGKTTTVHNANEDKGEEVFSLNVEREAANEFVNTESIGSVLRCNNITGNGKIRRGRSKTFADVVSGRLDLSTEEVAFETQNKEANFVERDDRREGIYLDVFLLTSLRKKCHPHESFAVKLQLLRIPRTVFICKQT